MHDDVGHVVANEKQAAAAGPFEIFVGQGVREFFWVETAAFVGNRDSFGPLAVTEASDVAAFVGNRSAFVPLAVTEGSDTAAFNVSSVNNGTLSATEGSDTAAANGTVAWTATLRDCVGRFAREPGEPEDVAEEVNQRVVLGHHEADVVKVREGHLLNSLVV